MQLRNLANSGLVNKLSYSVICEHTWAELTVMLSCVFYYLQASTGKQIKIRFSMVCELGFYIVSLRIY